MQTLSSGKLFADEVSSDRYQFAGAIHLGSQGLKHHGELRSSNEDRIASLLISIPLSNPGNADETPDGGELNRLGRTPKLPMVAWIA
jgi:hypothetical protein